MAEPVIYTVTALNRLVKQQLEQTLRAFWVEGEVSNLSRPVSGHLYFTLKDAQAQVRCAFFKAFNQRSAVVLKEGLQIRLRARYATLYEDRGEYQLQVEQVEPLALVGDWQLAVAQLKAKLQAEGLFAQERKRSLPTFPHCIGILSSPSGAALHDILSVLKRRWISRIILYPIVVQGQESAPSMLKMLALANSRQECDVLILARGGGAIEDLWAFNEEPVVRAVAASTLPIVTGVGHEVDVTLVDFAADQRAPTPSVAAELVTPDKQTWLTRIERYQSQLQQAQRQHLASAWTQWRHIATRLRAQQPERQLLRHTQRLDELALRLDAAQHRAQQQRQQRFQTAANRLQPSLLQRRLIASLQRLSQAETTLQRHMQRLLVRCQQQLQQAALALDMLSPLRVLGRGYAILQQEGGHVLRDARAVAPGTVIHARLAQGNLRLKVLEPAPLLPPK